MNQNLTINTSFTKRHHLKFEKASHSLRENIQYVTCVHTYNTCTFDKGLVSRIYVTLQPHNKKSNNQIKKQAKNIQGPFPTEDTKIAI